MRLVLDANEYLFALGDVRKPSCEQLLKALAAARTHEIRVERTLVKEVCRNLPKPHHRAFFGVLSGLIEGEVGIDEEFTVPYALGAHYQDLGFKEGDAHIAAYAEAIGTEVLVSENRRHFHALARHLPFQVADAETFLRQHADRPRR